MDGSQEKIARVEETIESLSLLIRSAIRKTCRSIDGLDLDDIEQEVKIAVWKEIQKSEKEIRNLGSYVWRITYTTTSKIMKRLGEQRKELIDLSAEERRAEEKFKTDKKDLPDYQLQYQETARIVREAVDRLIESRRRVVKLYLSGMTAGEINGFFGWSDGKARNLLSRGLADLREKLRERGFEYEE